MKKQPSPVFPKLCKAQSLPEPTPEYKFHPTRKWRFDWAFFGEDEFFGEIKLALEVEGAVWVQGRHTRGSGFVKDMEKYNEAACLGWRIIRVQPNELCTAKTIDLIQRALDA